LSPHEAEVYAREVLGDMTLTSDGVARTLALAHVDAPPPGELRDGVGTIRIEAGVRVPMTVGTRTIVLENRHRPDGSVYLANALLPESDAITIRRQQRSADQQLFRLDYDVARSRGSVVWLGFGAALLLLHARWRLRGAIGTLS
jgi:hypothetical protein